MCNKWKSYVHPNRKCIFWSNIIIWTTYDNFFAELNHLDTWTIDIVNAYVEAQESE